jgi:hypothetical protein
MKRLLRRRPKADPAKDDGPVDGSSAHEARLHRLLDATAHSSNSTDQEREIPPKGHGTAAS